MGQAVSPRQQLQGLLMEFVSVNVFPSQVVSYLGLSGSVPFSALPLLS